MRFATVKSGTATRFGLVENDAIHLAPEGESLRDNLAGDLGALAARLRKLPPQPLSQVEYAPVVPDPHHVLCIGLNYQNHRDETKPEDRKPYPEFPVVFMRYATSLAAHDESLPIPRVSDVVDYEAELAVIIGKGGRYIPKSEAMDHVAGYACFNDISMRDWQMKAEQWGPGKNFPKSGPLGPHLVTPDEIGDIGEARIRMILDGEVLQESWLKYLIFDLSTIISYCSNFVELRPGDVIATGTPGGVGFVRKPPILLSPGKTAIVEIDGIGRLENTFHPE